MIAIDTIKSALEPFANRDLAGVLAHFSDDAVLVDPHYPTGQMRGKAAIARGLAWGLKGVLRPQFEVKRIMVSDNVAAVEMHCHHLLRIGFHLDFDQVFVLDIRDDKIVRLQAYLTQAPSRLMRWFAWLTGAVWWLQAKFRHRLAQPG